MLGAELADVCHAGTHHQERGHQDGVQQGDAQGEYHNLLLPTLKLPFLAVKPEV